MATGTNINERTIDALPDKRLNLMNARGARLHGVVPAAWSVIRIGVRVAIEGIDANISLNPAFRFGFCNGATDICPAPACKHAAYHKTVDTGWIIGNSTDTDRQYQNVTPQGIGGNLNKMISGVESNLGNGAPTWYLPHITSDVGGSDADWGSCAFFELEKTTVDGSNLGTVFTVRINLPGLNDTTSTRHETRDNLFEAMHVTTLSSVSSVLPNSARQHISLASVALDEPGDGEFNAIFVSWDNPIYQFEISDVQVAIMVP